MTEPILAADFTAGTSVQVYTVDGTTFTTLGDPFSIAETAVPDANHNCVMHAHGGIYCYTKEGVFKLQTGLVGSVEDTWSSDTADGGFTFSSPGGTLARNMGMHHITIDNEPYLCGIYQSNTNSYTGWRYNLETKVLTEGSSITPSQAPGDIGLSFYYNELIFNFRTNNQVVIFEPRTLSITGKSVSATLEAGWFISSASSGVDMNVFNNTLYMVHRASSDGFPSISKWIGNNFIRELILHSDVSSVGGHPVLFDDDSGNMYALIYNDLTGTVNDGWRMWEIDTTGGTLTLGDEITNTVLPASLVPGNMSTTATGRWVCFKSPQSDGSNQIYLWFSADATGSTFDQYLWNGAASALTLQSSGGGDSQYCMSFSKRGGGARIFDQTEATISVYAHEKASGGERVTFKCFGGQTDQIVRFYVGSGGPAPETQATLTGAATGGAAARNGNQIELIDCDGVTEYTAIISSDSIDDNEKIELIASVSDT